LAKLQIDWKQLNSVSVTTGASATNDNVDMSSATALATPADRQANKPILIYLTTTNEKFAVEQQNVDATALMDERVGLSSKLFTMIKTDGDAITKSHPFAKNLGVGGDLPRFVVFSSKGQSVGSLEGTVSPSKLFQLMKKASAPEYVVNVDTWVKDYQKILTELDKLDNLQKALAEKESRAQTASAQKDVAQKKDLYAKQEEELKAREEKLANLKRKGEDVAKG
jgi:thioredoxin-related protein